ncbi:aminotransferase class I/II-fold pyridoxal phosphate-dependent enzyme [Sedimenticola selenatireducens]|uniref:DegT/DnrJ/EryC1/StrS aminotransferase family protein n=1 Tax=Sedimenticola selenatireducens TaxID=191960 RepID=A0A2N6D038_9GAMM|nr:aminotransferase class I/II-fold pyridoxal phosphate-dependent enzyme [Sedimenticola selenatireducens]PLX63034.1 MAG: hypothetical protein C0630_02400 [Sedimenticola selenatireducens]
MEVESNIGVSLSSSEPVNTIIPGSVPLSLGSFLGGRSKKPSILDSQRVVYLTSGRMAIAQALMLNRICEGDEVLVPAYHCSSMIAPVKHSGAKSVFYRILPDMIIDLEDIEQKLNDKTRLLLVAHYFGFPQPINALQKLCTDKGIVLLEDCAHALFSNYQGKPLGSFGDYAAGSLMKFFPVNDGGVLTANTAHNLQVQTEPGGREFELRCALNTLEKSFIYNRLKTLELLLWIPLKIKNLLWRWLKSQRGESHAERSPAASDGGFDFQPRWINTRISAFSLRISRMVSTNRIIDRRSSNYRWLSNALADIPNFRRLHPELPEGVVPYIFPIIIDQVDPAFINLRRMGVPLLRWEFLDEEVDSNTCKNSHYYSRHLVQIPCHQELHQAELEWMVDNIRHELSRHNQTG